LNTFPEWDYTPSVRLTPEAALWYAVLSTYLEDTIDKCRGGKRCYRHNHSQLRLFLKSSWTKFICEMVDLPYNDLVKSVERNIKTRCKYHGAKN